MIRKTLLGESPVNVNINCSNCAGFAPVMGGGFPAQQAASFQMLAMMMQMMSLMMSTLFGSNQSMMGGGFPAFGNAPMGFSGGGGIPGAANFLGGGGGGGVSTTGAAGPTVDPRSIQGAGWGADLARFAAGNANGPGGYCYKWVGQALRKFGVNVSGASAYMGADQLARNPKFREISVKPQDLPKLPAGAVVVWNKGSGHPHGHISIALGNGKEASDKIRNQITNYGTSVRVFIPK